MRHFLFALTLLLVLPLALAQGYKPKAGETVVKVEVAGRGDIYIRVAAKDAPRTAARFIELVKNGFYDGQRFHRVERSPRPYLAQIGDPASKSSIDGAGTGGSGRKIDFEDSKLPNGEGAVGLAHPENDRNGGDSQFYILLGPARFLDGSYTVFGQVVDGMDVVKKLSRGDKVVSVKVL
ncbi:peptidylprolyl isomerase [bacterium]|nr:MAG: peptidylprolyl isomerase [bacterium]